MIYYIDIIKLFLHLCAYKNYQRIDDQVNPQVLTLKKVSPLGPPAAHHVAPGFREENPSKSLHDGVFLVDSVPLPEKSG